MEYFGVPLTIAEESLDGLSLLTEYAEISFILKSQHSMKYHYTQSFTAF